jgi:hypothetical protein
MLSLLIERVTRCCKLLKSAFRPCDGDYGNPVGHREYSLFHINRTVLILISLANGLEGKGPPVMTLNKLLHLFLMRAKAFRLDCQSTHVSPA